jgi:hypothetical protein
MVEWNCPETRRNSGLTIKQMFEDEWLDSLDEWARPVERPVSLDEPMGALVAGRTVFK